MKLDNGNEVINSLWFSSMTTNDTIGIIIVKMKEGGIKAYIGTGKGENQEVDTKLIIRRGAKVYPETVLKLANNFMTYGDYDRR